jgi:hypothetical protein
VILIFTRRDYGALGALKRRPPGVSGQGRRQREWLSPKPNDSATGDGGIAAHLTILRVEVPMGSLADLLVDACFLPQWDPEDPRAVGEAFLSRRAAQLFP